MKISASISPPEHWLTLMNCAFCKRTPNTSPVYKCSQGHTICYTCFQQLVNDEAIPVCLECGSEQFTRHDVSDDFLRKLRTKPGIGRPYRYEIKSDEPDHLQPPPHELVTVEQLFQLPSQKLQQLFEQCTKEKLNYLKKLQATECLPGKIAQYNSSRHLFDDGQIPKEKIMENLQSRKPLKCPHDNCNKIIAISSFNAHFKHEHFDFKRYQVVRGSELGILFDPSMLQHGKSLCFGLVTLLARDEEFSVSQSLQGHQEHPKIQGRIQGHPQIASQKIGTSKPREIDSFWLMVTGSQNDAPSQAYVLFWIFTNNEDVTYNCTMEVTSEESIMTMTAFCRVNKIYESQCVAEVARKENCLYLAYSTVRSMLMYGPRLMFRMTIH